MTELCEAVESACRGPDPDPNEVHRRSQQLDAHVGELLCRYRAIRTLSTSVSRVHESRRDDTLVLIGDLAYFAAWSERRRSRR